VQDPFESGLLGLLISHMLGVPLYVQVHTDFLSKGYAQHSVLNRVRVSIAKFVIRHTDRIRVVAKGVKERIIQQLHPRAPIAVLPIYFDTERFGAAPVNSLLADRFKTFAWKVLYVGRLEAEKNVTLAISAFVASAPENACLIILGAGSKRAILENFVQENSVESRVFFEGEVDPAPYYVLADLVILTSHYEGYPAVVAEALSSGTPVLSTEVSGAREIGAFTASEHDFAGALREWFVDGAREMKLKDYPYANFDEYVQAYCDDIAGAVEK
jgi:glycosyltransferase involved in cell wall biosynthesis